MDSTIMEADAKDIQKILKCELHVVKSIEDSLLQKYPNCPLPEKFFKNLMISN